MSEVFLNDTDPREALRLFRLRHPNAKPTQFNEDEIAGVCEGCGRILIEPTAGGSGSEGLRFCDACVDEIASEGGGLIDETVEFTQEGME